MSYCSHRAQLKPILPVELRRESNKSVLNALKIWNQFEVTKIDAHA